MKYIFQSIALAAGIFSFIFALTNHSVGQLVAVGIYAICLWAIHED